MDFDRIGSFKDSCIGGGGPTQPVICLRRIQKKVNKVIKQFIDSQKDDLEQADLWARNSQNKASFVEKLAEQPTRWKCFVLWLFVIAVQEILANPLI
jgi:hypothetical protein